MKTKLYPINMLYLVMICDSTIKKATYYFDPKRVMKLTRRHKYRRNARQMEFVLTTGAPNYAERKFIQDCIKAGEPFPIRKVQIKHETAKTAK